MHEASADLRFEYAARLRDEIKDLKATRGQLTLGYPVGRSGRLRSPGCSDKGVDAPSPRRSVAPPARSTPPSRRPWSSPAHVGVRGRHRG